MPSRGMKCKLIDLIYTESLTTDHESQWTLAALRGHSKAKSGLTPTGRGTLRNSGLDTLREEKPED
jgi:hypothetical protein